MVNGKNTTAATSAAGVGNGGNTGQIARTSATQASCDLNSLGQKQTNGTIKNGKNGEDEMNSPSSTKFSTNNTATLPSDLSALLIRALNSAATASPPRSSLRGPHDSTVCVDKDACAQRAKRIWPLCSGLSHGGTGDLPGSAAKKADASSFPKPQPEGATAAIETQPKPDADAGNAPHPATQVRRGRLTLVSYPMTVFKGNAEQYIDAEPFLTPLGKLNLCTLLTDAEQNYKSRADRWLRFYVRMVESGVGAREREKWVQGVLERRHSMMMVMGENMFLGEVKDCFRR